MLSYTDIVLNRNDSGEIVTITLNRPNKRNALSSNLLGEYVDALQTLRTDTNAKVIITRGAGPSFCAGMDLRELGGWMAAWERDELPWSDGGPLVNAIKALRAHPCVTLASVHGFCAGGGLALAVAHELAIASESARFILPETQRGSFGALAAAAMHSALPPKWAFDVQLSGRELTAEEAVRLGLVSRVCADDRLGEQTAAFADDVATRKRAPLSHAKMAAYTAERMTFEEALLNDLIVAARQNRSARPFDDVDTFLEGRRRGPVPVTGE